MIHWERIAKPQSDQYDSIIIAEQLHKRFGWTKHTPAVGVPTICDGHVAVVEDPCYTNQQLAQVSESIRTLNAVDRWNGDVARQLDPFLRQWTDGFEMLKLFLDEFWPKWATFMHPHSRGCTSGHFEIGNPVKYPPFMRGRVLNAVYVSINHMQGCAQGIYHEVGHARLEALGMGIETHDNTLILNTPDELYDSPIRRDKKRPMSAVIQAIYSWLIFGENDLQCAAIPGNASNSADFVVYNLPKIEDGLKEIRAHVRCTPDGTKFMDGYFAWGEDVCARARILGREQFGEEGFNAKYAAAAKYKDSTK